MADIEHGSVTLELGGTASLPELSRIDRASFYVLDGSTLSVPATSYTLRSTANHQDATFRAIGQGSVLDLSGLRSITGGTHLDTDLVVEALSGGRVLLSDVSQIVEPDDAGTDARASSFQLRAEGVGSEIDLSSLQRLIDRAGSSVSANDNGEYSRMTAANSGTITLTSSFTRADGLYIPIDGTGTQLLDSLAELSSGRVEVSQANFAFPGLLEAFDTDFVADDAALDLGNLQDLSHGSLTLRHDAGITLTNLTDIDSTSFFVYDGNSLSVPGNSYTHQSTANYQDTQLLAEGLGSTLVLPDVTTIRGGTHLDTDIRIDAVSGGRVLMESLAEIIDPVTTESRSQSVKVTASGPDSLVNTPALAAFTDTFADGTANGENSLLSALHFGRVVVASAGVDLTGVDVTVANRGTIQGSLTTNGSATVSGNGTINGSLISHATVSPGTSPGQLTVTGDYTQGPGGTLAIEVDGPEPGVSFDRLQVDGALDLDGRLNVVVDDGYTPANGAELIFIAGASRNGSFSEVDVTNGASLFPFYAASDVRLIKTDTTEAIIGDRVWDDENRNGILNSGEEGVAGAPVRLVDRNVDDFENGRAGWTTGNSNPNPPTTPEDGGPDGDGDAFLRVTSTGTGTSGSKLVTFNTDQWAGDLSRFTAVRFDANNLGSTPLSLRLAIDGPGGKFASTTPVTLASASGWLPAVISLKPDDWTADGGSDIEATLANVSQLRLLHNSAADFNGVAVNATLGIDNVAGVIGETTTDDLGNYRFTVLPGDYRVLFTAVGEFTPRLSPQDQGNDTVDSDAHATTGLTSQFTVNVDAPISSLDAGIMLGDAFELNDTQQTATPITEGGRIEDLSIHKADDTDYFSFTVPADAIGSTQDFVEIQFTHRDGDLSLTVWQAQGTSTLVRVGRSDSVTDNERVSLHGLLPGNYLVQVDGRGSDTAFYDLAYRLPRPVPTTSDALEPNNSTSEATEIDASQTIEDLSIHSTTDQDYFVFSIPSGAIGTSRDFVEIGFSQQHGDLDLTLLNAAGERLRGSAGVTDAERIRLEGLGPGDYYALVNGFGGARAPYNITLQLPVVVAGDQFETNNSAAQATVISQSQRVSGLSIHQTTDQDYFTFTVPQNVTGTSSNFVAIDFSQRQGDLDLELLDADENRLDASASSTDGERISLDGLAAGTYFVRVFGFRSATAGYDIEFDLPEVISVGDPLEPNNTPAEATEIRGAGTISDLSIHNTTDKDFFTFVVDNEAVGIRGDFAEIRFPHRQGDLDLFLLDSNQEVIESRQGVTDIERMDLEGLEPGTYYLQVSAFAQATAKYRLSFQLPQPRESLPADQFEPNNAATQEAATPVRASSEVDGLTIHDDEDVDYFRFDLPAVKLLRQHGARIEFVHAEGDLNMRLLDQRGRIVGRSFGVTNVESVSLGGLSAGVYYVEVSGLKGATNRYDVAFTLPEGIETPDPDGYEPNNSTSAATELRESGRIDGLTIHSGTDTDFFQIEVGQPRGGDFVAIDFSHAVGDLDLRLIDSEDNVVGFSNTAANREIIELDELTQGTYFVEVFGFAQAVGQYSLTLELHDATQPDNSDRFEPNDTAGQATDLRRPVNERIGDLTIHATGSGASVVANPDFYSFELGQGASAAHSIVMQLTGDIDFELIRENGSRVASSRVSASTSARQVPLAGEAAGTYTIHVFGANGVGTGAYSLDFRTPSDRAVAADRLEGSSGNNSRSTATELGGIEGETVISDLSIHRDGTGSDEDFFEVQLLQDGDDGHFVEIQFSGQQGNLDLEFLDASGNTVASSTSTTDDERITLDEVDAGTYLVRVFAGSAGNTADYQLVFNAPRRRNGFQIEVNFTDDNMTDPQRAVFTDAAARWSEIIVGDLPDVRLPDGTVIDDVVIDASAPNIDGPGGILGAAGPDRFRAGSALPSHGIMRFDLADIGRLESTGSFKDVILHEMGHVIGIGTLWRYLGFVDGAGTADPRFTGENAVAEYSTLVGSAQTSIPVANTGGQGTRDAHWRESTFRDEVMTGYLSGTTRPISRMTAGSLEDIGYVVNYEAADDFSLPQSNRQQTPGVRTISSILETGEIEVIGILDPGTEAPDTIGISNPVEFLSDIVAPEEQLFAADDHEGEVVQLRSNQTLTGFTIQPGSRQEREDVFTFTLTGRGTFEDGIEVNGAVPGQLLDLQLRSADNSTVLSNGLIGGQRVSLAGYQPGVYFISVNANDPNEYTFEFDGQFTAGEPEIAALDLDGNSDFQFSNDGIILLAYALGTTGQDLEPFRAPGDNRTGAQIESTIEVLADAIDIDGDGTFRFANDGILILAHALGSQGNDLTPFAASGAIRDGAAMTERLNGLVIDATPQQNRMQSPYAESEAFATVVLSSAPRTDSTSPSSHETRISDDQREEIVTWWATSRNDEPNRTQHSSPETAKLDLGSSLEPSPMLGSEWVSSASKPQAPEVDQLTEAADEFFTASADLSIALIGLQ